MAVAGSDRGGQRAAALCSLSVTAKMNDIDPQAWLADVLAGICRASGLRHRRFATVELATARHHHAAGRLNSIASDYSAAFAQAFREALTFDRTLQYTGGAHVAADVDVTAQSLFLPPRATGFHAASAGHDHVVRFPDRK